MPFKQWMCVRVEASHFAVRACTYVCVCDVGTAEHYHKLVGHSSSLLTKKSKWW